MECVQTALLVRFLKKRGRMKQSRMKMKSVLFRTGILSGLYRKPDLQANNLRKQLKHGSKHISML